MATTVWPYPSYADRRWLGGDGGPDRDLAAVIKTLRSTVAEAGGPVTGEPDSLLGALTHLAAIDERVDWAILSLVGEARALGLSWSTIGAALGVTKQGAQQRFASYVEQALRQATPTAPDASEPEDQPGADQAGGAVDNPI